MEKRKNKKSTFSSPKDYVLPNVYSSKRNPYKTRTFSSLLRGYDNSHSSIRTVNADIQESSESILRKKLIPPKHTKNK